MSEPMWMFMSDRTLQRRQSSATADGMTNGSGGTAIPAWVYSTGFADAGVKSRVQLVFVDTTGSVTVTLYKEMSGTPSRSVSFTSSGEHEKQFAADVSAFKWRAHLTAANTVQVKRLKLARTPVAARGG